MVPLPWARNGEGIDLCCQSMPPANAHLKVMRWQHVAAGTNAHEGQQACEAVHFLAGEGSMRKADHGQN